MKIKRILPLDSLRGISAVGIAFFWHYVHFRPTEFPFSKKAYWLYNYGFSFVDLFFILSGFVFCYVYKDKIINNKISFKDYAINRFSRLYPMMLLTLIYVAIVQSLRMSIIHNFFQYPYNDAWHFIMNIFCIQKGWVESGFSFNAPSWAISCQIVTYIIFFILLKKFNDNKKYFGAYIILILIGLSVSKLKLKYPLFNVEMARTFIGFFIGCFVYEFNNYINKNKYKNKIICINLIILIGLIMSSSIYGHVILGDWINVYRFYIYPSIILISLNFKFINSILSFKPLIYLGNISYSIYLVHFPIQLTIKTFDDIFKLNINYSSKLFFFSYIGITIIDRKSVV